MKHFLYLAFFTVTISLSGCLNLFDPGTNKSLKVISNPSQCKKAILFLKDGNTVTDNSLQVSIKNTNEVLENNETGNTFTTDSNHSKVILDSISIHLTWIGNNKLLISYNKILRIFKQTVYVNGVHIEYKPI